MSVPPPCEGIQFKWTAPDLHVIWWQSAWSLLEVEVDFLFVSYTIHFVCQVTLFVYAES
jgi:hypothetical protein